MATEVIITAAPATFAYTGNPITYGNYTISVSGLTPQILYNGGIEAPIYPGVYSVEISIPFGSNYFGAEITELTIVKAPSFITFPEFTYYKQYGDAEFTIEASSSSGSQVVLTSENETVLTISGDKAKIVNTGPRFVYVTASEGSPYHEADIVTRRLTVLRSSNRITATAPTGITTRTIPFQLVASSTSGLPLSYSVLQGPVGITEGGEVTVLGPGLVRIGISQGGSSNYQAAPSIEVQFTISVYTQVFQEGVSNYLSTASKRSSCPTPSAQDFLLCEPTPGVWPSLQNNLGGLWERVELWWEYVKKTENW